MREQTAVTELRRDRDRARGIAVELEQQIAAALALHPPYMSFADFFGCDHDECREAAATCPSCGGDRPCPTRRVLDPAVDE